MVVRLRAHQLPALARDVHAHVLGKARKRGISTNALLRSCVSNPDQLLGRLSRPKCIFRELEKQYEEILYAMGEPEGAISKTEAEGLFEEAAAVGEHVLRQMLDVPDPVGVEQIQFGET
jgi:hypothetical protein